MSIRVTVSLPDKAAANLKEICEQEDMTVSEVMRRAFAMYEYLHKAEAAGQAVQVHDPKTRTTSNLQFITS